MSIQLTKSKLSEKRKGSSGVNGLKSITNTGHNDSD